MSACILIQEFGWYHGVLASSLFAGTKFFCPYIKKQGGVLVKEKLTQIKEAVHEQLSQANELEALEAIRIKYLGKKGELTAVLKGMGALSSEERPVIGALANEIRALLENEIDTKKSQLLKEATKKLMIIMKKKWMP